MRQCVYIYSAYMDVCTHIGQCVYTHSDICVHMCQCVYVYSAYMDECTHRSMCMHTHHGIDLHVTCVLHFVQCRVA